MSNNHLIISINLDSKCKRCGKGDATQNGYCMRCIAKMLKEGKFDHILKKYKPNLKKITPKEVHNG